MIGATLAIRTPFGIEPRAEEIPTWLAFLGTVVVAGVCFALYCLL